MGTNKLKQIFIIPTSNRIPPDLMDTKMLDFIIFKAKSLRPGITISFYSMNDEHPFESKMVNKVRRAHLGGQVITRSRKPICSGSMVILWNGDVLPCTSTIEVVGNIYHDGMNNLYSLPDFYAQCEECPIKNDRILEM